VVDVMASDWNEGGAVKASALILAVLFVWVRACVLMLVSASVVDRQTEERTCFE